MSILWEKSGTWRWLVRRTKESKPFFIGFATVCGVIPGIIGFCVMSATNTRSPELEAKLRKNARPETLDIKDEESSRLVKTRSIMSNTMVKTLRVGNALRIVKLPKLFHTSMA